MAWTRRNSTTTVKFLIHTFHVPSSIPPVTRSIHDVYWNVYCQVRNPATTEKFRIHTFHVPPSIPPVTHSIQDVYWNVYWHVRNPARTVKFRIHTFHVPPSIPPVTHSIQDVYSCFEKGCPTKPYATMPIGIMGNAGLWYLIEALGVSAT